MNSDIVYQVSAELKSLGDELDDAALSRSLFRFPGPCGLFDLSYGQMEQLAPRGMSYVHLSDHRYREFQTGIELFGTLVVFNPATIQAVKIVDPEVLAELGFSNSAAGQIFLGNNLPLSFEADYAWLPGDKFGNSHDAAACRSIHDVRELVGNTYADQLDQAFSSVRTYMEEVSAVLQQNVPPPGQPWYKISPEERRRILSAGALDPIWR